MNEAYDETCVIVATVDASPGVAYLFPVHNTQSVFLSAFFLSNRSI